MGKLLWTRVEELEDNYRNLMEGVIPDIKSINNVTFKELVEVKKLEIENTDFIKRLLAIVENQQLNIENLQNKVQCGMPGHKFQLQNLLEDQNIIGESTFSGEFKCCNCGAVICRNMTLEEVEAAKKLNF